MRTIAYSSFFRQSRGKRYIYFAKQAPARTKFLSPYSLARTGFRVLQIQLFLRFGRFVFAFSSCCMFFFFVLRIVPRVFTQCHTSTTRMNGEEKRINCTHSTWKFFFFLFSHLLRNFSRVPTLRELFPSFVLICQSPLVFATVMPLYRSSFISHLLNSFFMIYRRMNGEE